MINWIKNASRKGGTQKLFEGVRGVKIHYFVRNLIDSFFRKRPKNGKLHW